MFMPMMNVITLSFEPERIAIETGVIHLWPKEWTTVAYRAVFRHRFIMNSFFNSVYVTLVGASLGTILTAMTAYGLADDKMKGVRVFSHIILFTMMISAGLIPMYMLIRDLKLINSLWALILPGMISAYNVIITRVFIRSLPESLTEAAEIDGCSEAGIFFKIILPLSLPIIATIFLFYAVGKWNSYFDAVMYISKMEKKTLQVILREILFVNEGDITMGVELGKNAKMATAVIAIIPIVCIYPFLQKYFTKGILLGAVKG